MCPRCRHTSLSLHDVLNTQKPGARSKVPLSCFCQGSGASVEKMMDIRESLPFLRYLQIPGTWSRPTKAIGLFSPEKERKRRGGREGGWFWKGGFLMNQVFFHPEIKTFHLEMAGVPSPFMNSEHTGPSSIYRKQDCLRDLTKSCNFLLNTHFCWHNFSTRNLVS